jgi:hypothetical protein
MVLVSIDDEQLCDIKCFSATRKFGNKKGAADEEKYFI